MEKETNFYQELLDILNKQEQRRCIHWSVYNHKFPEWYCNEEHICEFDNINYKWEVIKEYVSTITPGRGLNMCNAQCRKVIDKYMFHNKCEVIDFLEMLIRINKKD